MAGKFRGEVGKIAKAKSKAKKGKTSNALVKRGRKLAPEDVRARVEALVNVNAELNEAPSKGAGSSTATSGSGFLSKVKVVKDTKAPKRRTLQVVDAGGKAQVVEDDINAGPERSVKEAQGLKLLHRAVKEQSHGRVLPHQQRHDYEYKLRSIATQGVVRLFNSLAQAQQVGAKVMTESERVLTLDKAQEKKQVASRDAFLAALRQTTD